jgi:lauroyl/myristoyl acyltransferase
MTTAQQTAEPAAAPLPLAPVPAAPSTWYRTECWKAGLRLAQLLPPNTLRAFARTLTSVYAALASKRREVVVRNLLPALNNDRAEAERVARQIFREFGMKLADLWRFESGISVVNDFNSITGATHLEEAVARKNGVLLVTPHIGNWEFGGPLLGARGINLLVITLAEPDETLTRLRERSRFRWGIETIVIGQDPFAVIEVIRRLEQGAVVALLIDRPPRSSAVPVRLFGREFSGSVAAAELARATGCTILPVCLPRNENGYEARVMPPIPYDRAALRKTAAKIELTQRLFTLFEPLIQKHLNQWYHFVPIWPES